MFGVLFWVLGHWFADVVWFSFLGYSIYKGKRHISGAVKSGIITLCGIVMISLGVFFVCRSILG